MMVTLETGQESFEVEFASGMLSKMIGMRFQTEGKMLFEFSRPQRPWIDMFFVRTDLELYFIAEGKVVERVEAERPGLNPLNWRLYRPEKPVEMLLESSEPLRLERGDEVKVER